MTSRRPLVAIVDDDESVCRAMKRLVRSLEMEADTFHSGTAFLELYAAMPSSRPDCLILDLQMPGMDGLEVQERLAELNSAIPIVFITAHDAPGMRERALSAGAIAYLRKPFDDELLVAALEAALARAQ